MIMEKLPCSVGVLTLNSEQTLERCLDSVKAFKEIIVCDGGSRDATLNIAKKFGARIIEQNPSFQDNHKKIIDFAGVRNQVLDNISYDWFFYIDSDEAASSALVEEMRKIINNPNNTFIYNIPLRIFIEDKAIKYSSNYPGYQKRFFNHKKTRASFVKPVHEKIAFDDNIWKVDNLNSPWFVYWSEEEARNYLKEGERYLNMEIKRIKNMDQGDFVRFVIIGNMVTSLKILIKSLRNYIFHEFKDCMPVYVEFGRMMYHLRFIYLALKSKFQWLGRK